MRADGSLLSPVGSGRSTDNWEDAASTRATEDAEAVAGLGQLRLPSSERERGSSVTRSATDHAALCAAAACESAGASAGLGANPSAGPSGEFACASSAAETDPPGGADGGGAADTDKGRDGRGRKRQTWRRGPDGDRDASMGGE